MTLRLFVSGFLFFSAGGILWNSFRSLKKHKTTAEPTGIPGRLVCSGPFRFSRNPMYSAQSVLLAGTGFLLGSFWPFFAIPLMVLALYRLVIVPEERCLEKIFGQEYREYCKTVRRWI
ncbi:MAG TPA: isoprenylcysteine carboxylmethyltransferase family protein [bacterium]|nr:isoprenylcysteine carboxylmethyltransferase family protein [bacterium]